VLLDFDGAPADRRDAKRREAQSMLDATLGVGADTLLAPASTDPNCDPSRVVENMRWLAREAGTRDLRVA
jgi:4-hydroxyphenylpyruvate dioxygenase